MRGIFRALTSPLVLALAVYLGGSAVIYLAVSMIAGQGVHLFEIWARAERPRASDAYIDFLASDSYIIVGDVILTAPFVALPDYVFAKPGFSLDRAGDRRRAQERLEWFRTSASKAQTAPILEKAEINIRPYGWNDADASYRRICFHLTRQWARSVCDDPWSPIAQSLPTFYIFDIRKPDAFDSHSGPDGETIGGQLRTMRIEHDAASVVCGSKTSSGTRFCTAATLIQQNLAAVWLLSDDMNRGETHLERADREANAIANFVRYAMGPIEDFPPLLRRSCLLRPPKSRPGLHTDQCSDVKPSALPRLEEQSRD